jgi:hypothetical protein
MPVRLGNDTIEIIRADTTHVVDTIKSTGERDGDIVVNVPVVPVPQVVSSVPSVTIDATYKYMAFTHSGLSEDQTEHSLTFNTDTECDILIVGGGGGGGKSGVSGAGGGGGAGGLIYLQNQTLTSGTEYVIKVGKGGDIQTSEQALGGQGINSSFNDNIAIGGGGGTGADASGVGDGGSGGGEGTGNGGFGNIDNSGSGTTGQGYEGGRGYPSKSNSGGGGGSGGAGEDGQVSRGGNGGVGTLINITGQDIYYAGGGGGGSEASNNPGLGIAGGGNGGGTDSNGVNALANTGSGGGGAGGSGNSGSGGSGIVIIRYKVISDVITMQPQSLTHYTAERMYPPTRDLTSASHTISGQPYGNGVYVVNESTYKDTRRGFTAFNTSVSNGYCSADNPQQYSSGVYIQDNYLVSDYKGDWITIKIPYPITLTKYGIQSRTDLPGLAPGKYKIYGSNNGTNWDELVHKTDKISYTNNLFEERLNILNEYEYFGLVVNELLDSTVYTLSFDEWYIYGKEYLYDEPDYKVLTFTYDSANDVSGQTSYTLTFDNPTECDILIVAGGGAGGGGDEGAGGGAGGLVLINNIMLHGEYKILVGKGGVGDTSANNDTENGKDTIFNVYGTDGVDSFIAVGGGGGGVGHNSSNNLRDGNNGGSGGGASGEYASRFGGSSTQNQYIYDEIQRGYGNKGGDNPNTSYGKGSAGGGGAGFPGTDSNSTNQGVPGGDGLAIINSINLKTHFNINNTTIGHHINDEVYFAGGGGGGNINNIARDDNSGGKGGGGQGSTSGSGMNGSNGLINSGGGGGGGQNNSTSGKGGDGGSGIVIIRYKQQYNQVPYNAQWTYSSTDPTVHHYGNVGIGTTAHPSTALTIKGDINVIGDYYKNDMLLTEKWLSSPQNTNNIYRDKGFVGIGIYDPLYSLHVEGQLYAGSGGITGNGSTAWTSTSDSRVKQNIVPASGQKCVENVRNINLYRFNYNSSLIDTDDKHQLGFIAQEVQQYYPKAVKTNNLVLKNNMKIDNLLSVDVTQINYTLYGTVKKLAEDINTIREKLGITEIQTDVKNLAYVRKDGEDSTGLIIS